MIDHVSIAVRDLAACGALLRSACCAHARLRRKLRRRGPATVGFGKKYPEFWLNERRAMTPVDAGQRRAHLPARVERRGGGGVPCRGAGGRRHLRRRARARARNTIAGYYAAFIRDPEGNQIEAVTFTRAQASERGSHPLRRPAASSPSPARRRSAPPSSASAGCPRPGRRPDSSTSGPARMNCSSFMWSSSAQSGSQKLLMLASRIGFLWRPSCAQVICSTSSSSVPMPPGSATKASASLEHRAACARACRA